MKSFLAFLFFQVAFVLFMGAMIVGGGVIFVVIPISTIHGRLDDLPPVIWYIAVGSAVYMVGFVYVVCLTTSKVD